VSIRGYHPSLALTFDAFLCGLDTAPYNPVEGYGIHDLRSLYLYLQKASFLTTDLMDNTDFSLGETGCVLFFMLGP
jgi:hypothetical protein